MKVRIQFNGFHIIQQGRGWFCLCVHACMHAQSMWKIYSQIDSKTIMTKLQSISSFCVTLYCSKFIGVCFILNRGIGQILGVFNLVFLVQCPWSGSLYVCLCIFVRLIQGMDKQASYFFNSLFFYFVIVLFMTSHV